MEAIIFIGIQATGKSTFFQQRFFATHVRINLDMLKTRNRERILLAACLEARQTFVIDNTNLTREASAGYSSQAKAAGFKVIGYYFRSRRSESRKSCLRNAQDSGRGIGKPAFQTHQPMKLPAEFHRRRPP